MGNKKLKSKGILYKGSYNDPAVNNVLKKLLKDPKSLDSSGFGTHLQVNVDSAETKRRNRRKA